MAASAKAETALRNRRLRFNHNLVATTHTSNCPGTA
jgi:hypothetical protein